MRSTTKLTLAFLPAFAALIALGIWQIQRLHWKEALIARIHTGLATKPVSIGEAYGDAADVDASFHVDQADYRRIVIRGKFENNKEILFFATDANGAPVYHVVTPFYVSDLWDFWRCSVCPVINRNGTMQLIAGRQLFHHRGGTVLVDRGIIPMSLADPTSRKLGQLEGERTITGVLRKPDPPNWFTPPSDIVRRIVHTRDPKTLVTAFGWKNYFPMFLEADATPNPGGWPKGGQTVVNVPNNHLQYAITWFGLAAAMLGVFVAYVISGRSKTRS